jgi:hypothetical protein
VSGRKLRINAFAGEGWICYAEESNRGSTAMAWSGLGSKLGSTN